MRSRVDKVQTVALTAFDLKLLRAVKAIESASMFIRIDGSFNSLSRLVSNCHALSLKTFAFKKSVFSSALALF